MFKELIVKEEPKSPISEIFRKYDTSNGKPKRDL